MSDDLGRDPGDHPDVQRGENIDTITARLRAAVPDAHILVADDNSPDGTGQRSPTSSPPPTTTSTCCTGWARKGLGAAYLAGFAWGLEHGYDVLVEHDADGSHQPEQLPALLDALQDADMVKGSRWVPGARSSTGRSRARCSPAAAASGPG